MCGFIVLPPRHPLASQALHHFGSTKSGISRETQVVQHADHLIMALLRELRIIDRLSVNQLIIFAFEYMFDNFVTSSIRVSGLKSMKASGSLIHTSHPSFQGRKIA